MHIYAIYYTIYVGIKIKRRKCKDYIKIYTKILLKLLTTKKSDVNNVVPLDILSPFTEQFL